MEAKREMSITLTLSEEEAHLMITGLNYGTMHVKDHIKTPESEGLINKIYNLESVIRNSLYMRD